MTDLVDVVVPARDAETTLPACLDALIAAGFHPSAITVCDDGSRDDTAAIARGADVLLLRTGGVGAGAARNAGVTLGQAPLILFVDADVVLHPGAPNRITAFFDAHPDHAGLIGSYDDAPPAPGTLSRIRNLLHHHTHQRSGGDVPSFWAGCGVLRRADFEAVGGFEPGHPLEDVALGFALARRGRCVRLDPELHCTHLKAWTWRSMMRADFAFRALPWSRLLLDRRNDGVPAALNASSAGKANVLLAGAMAMCVGLSLALPAIFLPLTTLAALAFAALNIAFLRIVARRLGATATVQAVGVLWLHHLCAGAGFATALLERAIGRRPGGTA